MNDEDLVLQRELFLLNVADGTPFNMSAYEVGWTPRQLKQQLNDPDFAEMVHYARERMIDSVERAMVKLALKGNLGAQQMVLYNLRQDVWKDVKRIEVKGEIHHSHTEVEGAKQAVLEALRTFGAQALQPGGSLDILDAEVIDDGDESSP